MLIDGSPGDVRVVTVIEAKGNGNGEEKPASRRRCCHWTALDVPREGCLITQIKQKPYIIFLYVVKSREARESKFHSKRPTS